jgi:hypothetical protein
MGKRFVWLEIKGLIGLTLGWVRRFLSTNFLRGDLAELLPSAAGKVALDFY